MIAILGSGFGLYGYLPALVEGCGISVVLPEKSRARYLERPELARFAGDIQWEANESKALDHANGAVIALRPDDQAHWIPLCLQRSNLECLLLEKPLASSPGAAADLCRELSRSDKIIRMGYTFRYTNWGEQLGKSLGKAAKDDSVSIQWNFLAHHFRHDQSNWKRSTASGGGALRFYGIQLIAFLAYLGYRDIHSSRTYGASPDQVEKWTTSLTGEGLPDCRLEVDSKATSDSFRVDLSGITLVDLNNPFANDKSDGLDRRVPVLTRVCQTLWEPSVNETSWYAETVELWRRIEGKTLFEIRPTLTEAL